MYQVFLKDTKEKNLFSRNIPYFQHNNIDDVNYLETIEVLRVAEEAKHDKIRKIFNTRSGKKV